MTYTWGRLTGPKGDRPNPVAFAVPLTKTPITLVAPIVQYDATWTTCTVYKTEDGMCFMEGLVRRSDNGAIAASGTVLAVLPAAYCPTDRTLLNGVSNADGVQCFTRIDVDPNGNVLLQAATANPVWLSLTGRWPVPVPIDVPVPPYPPAGPPGGVAAGVGRWGTGQWGVSTWKS